MHAIECNYRSIWLNSVYSRDVQIFGPVSFWNDPEGLGLGWTYRYKSLRSQMIDPWPIWMLQWARVGLSKTLGKYLSRYLYLRSFNWRSTLWALDSMVVCFACRKS